MPDKSKSKARKPAQSATSRADRLAAALRANLLKRKAQARAKSSSKPCEGRGQDPS